MALFGPNEKRLRNAFNSIHKDIEEHLESINANTEEIIENRYLIQELSERLDKLKSTLAPEPIQLTLREQEVFMHIYMSEKGITLENLAKKTSLPSDVVSDILFSLLRKHIPINKEENTLELCTTFRVKQAKHNIVGIHEGLGQEIEREQQQSLL